VCVCACVVVHTPQELDVRGALARAYQLRHRMQHFIENYVYYMMFEVRGKSMGCVCTLVSCVHALAFQRPHRCRHFMT
jgi:hypothetical protein